jgi:hypothetical protein
VSSRSVAPSSSSRAFGEAERTRWTGSLLPLDRRSGERADRRRCCPLVSGVLHSAASSSRRSPPHPTWRSARWTLSSRSTRSSAPRWTRTCSARTSTSRCGRRQARPSWTTSERGSTTSSRSIPQGTYRRGDRLRRRPVGRADALPHRPASSHRQQRLERALRVAALGRKNFSSSGTTTPARTWPASTRSLRRARRIA